MTTTPRLGKVTFLGTGTSQGVPVVSCQCEVCRSTSSRDHRLRCSLLVETEHMRVIIDCGPDFRQQCLKYHITFVDSIILTHEHMDHVAGIDDVRPFNYLQHHRMPIYAESRVINFITQTFKYIFDPVPYSGLPLITLNEIKPYQPFLQGDLPIEPIRILHGKLPILGFKMGDLVYITDAKSIDSTAVEAIKDCKTVIINALHHKSHHSHMNLEEALAFAASNQLNNVYLTHISHQMGLHADIDATLPSAIQLAYDGLSLEFNY